MLAICDLTGVSEVNEFMRQGGTPVNYPARQPGATYLLPMGYIIFCGWHARSMQDIFFELVMEEIVLWLI